MIFMAGKWGRVSKCLSLDPSGCVGVHQHNSVETDNPRTLHVNYRLSPKSLDLPKHRVTVVNKGELDKHYIFSCAQGT